jgi:hypothetical protein
MLRSYCHRFDASIVFRFVPNFAADAIAAPSLPNLSFLHMNGRLIVGAVLSALVFFFWGFLFWGILEIGTIVYHPLPNAETVVGALRSSGMKSGTYMYPLMEHTGFKSSDAGAQEKLNAMFREGPLFEVRYHADGVDEMSPVTLVVGYLHFLVSTLLAGLLMRMGIGSLRTYGRRLTFVVGLGAFAAVFAHLSGPIWFSYPWDRALLDVGYDLVGWFLAGLVLARFVRPETRTQAPASA